MTCPKCGSERIALAHEEAPPWAKSWTKCFACGKRWNLDGGPPKGKWDTDEDAEDLDETPAPVKLAGDDLVSKIMSLARNPQPIQKKEKPMKGMICTKKNCGAPAADDSVRCPKHRDMQRAHNAKFQGRTLPASATLKRKYTRRTPQGGGTDQTVVATLPAKRAAAPIVLAEPQEINPRPSTKGSRLFSLERGIEQCEADLVILRSAKEILERHAS